ncbi:MAG TPA: lipoyl synthase [bacterium]|nr:lipoyl synthase [bacterium]HQG44406.1 lipoyl synthase [bacterium]HQI48215.1 lipoyl synthase [bacterium]HQJ64787.1 lipoyl synthase [bacterium]
MSSTKELRRPHWLKVDLAGKGSFYQVKELVAGHQLHTVCQSARCPNIGECWGRKTATFMILGDICSRNCGFCAVLHGRLQPPDPDEPARVAAAVQELGLRYAVVTSVTRDDLPDGGAAHFAATISAIRARSPRCQVEVLIPDLGGSISALAAILAAQPDVLSHNLETVQALYPRVRPQADYRRSLTLLAAARKAGSLTKSGLMLGLGETRAQLQAALADLRAVDCQLLTLGQYLPPSRHHLPVDRFIEPGEFAEWQETAIRMGFIHVESAPLVRSSYRADRQSTHA